MCVFVVSCPAAHSASIMSGFLLCCCCPAACFASIMSSILLCFSCPEARFASIMLRFRASFVVQSSTGRYFLQALQDEVVLVALSPPVQTLQYEVVLGNALCKRCSTK